MALRMEESSVFSSRSSNDTTEPNRTPSNSSPIEDLAPAILGQQNRHQAQATDLSDENSSQDPSSAYSQSIVEIGSESDSTSESQSESQSEAVSDAESAHSGFEDGADSCVVCTKSETNLRAAALPSDRDIHEEHSPEPVSLADEIRIQIEPHIQDLPQQPPSTSAPAEAAVECFRSKILAALKSGLSGFVSSSGYLVFGKDFWEGAIAEIILSLGQDPAVAPWSYIAAAAPGIWYGLTHQAVSRATAGWLNYCLSIPRRRPTGATEWERQKREFLATTLPGLITYTSCHVVRGMATEAMTEPMEVAFSKFAASSLAGALAAFIGELYCQCHPEGFQTEQPKPSLLENFADQKRRLFSDLTFRKIGHDYLGKVVGSCAGMVAGVPLAPQDLPGVQTPIGQGATQGGLNKFVFQSGFYAGIHFFSAAGHLLDKAKSALYPPSLQHTTVVPYEISGGQNGGQT